MKLGELGDHLTLRELLEEDVLYRVSRLLSKWRMYINLHIHLDSIAV
jgi:hypothetical protein